MTAKCPTCSRPVDMGPGNAWRPFCSERCRLIDLGDWLEGRHRIPADEPAPSGEPGDSDPPLTRH